MENSPGYCHGMNMDKLPLYVLLVTERCDFADWKEDFFTNLLEQAEKKGSERGLKAGVMFLNGFVCTRQTIAFLEDKFGRIPYVSRRFENMVIADNPDTDHAYDKMYYIKDDMFRKYVDALVDIGGKADDKTADSGPVTVPV